MKVFVCRGLPGSGKSSWVRNMFARPDSPAPKHVVSADKYHMVRENGQDVYRFKRENAGAAHNSCLQQFVVLVSAPCANVFDDEVYVDNTNLSVWELAPYYRVAEAFGHEVRIMHFVCSLATAKKRNVHEVPDAVLEQMASRIEKLPPWWLETVVDTEPKEGQS